MNQNTKVKLCCCQKMPIIALGVWQSGKDTKQAVLDALKAGYRHIDTVQPVMVMKKLLERLSKKVEYQEKISLSRRNYGMMISELEIHARLY